VKERNVAAPFVTSEPRPSWVTLVLASGTLGILLVVGIADPAASSHFPPCPFHLVTGLHCPGCGSLRATHQLLHGKPAAALGLNPLAVLLSPVILFSLLVDVLAQLGLCRRRVVKVPSWVGWAVLTVVLAFGILRNIPFWPFTVLAP